MARSPAGFILCWHDCGVTDREWLAGWNPRYARILVAVQTPEARAALVDTNGDGRELWFAADVRSPAGEWVMAVDWDDVAGQRPPERLEHCDLVVGWGTGRRTVVEWDGARSPVTLGTNGWWLLVAVPDPPAGACR